MNLVGQGDKIQSVIVHFLYFSIFFFFKLFYFVLGYSRLKMS